MAEPLVLYTNPMSRGRIARWMLEEIGAPYETILVDYGAPMKAAAYTAINPMGKVPALRHGATVVTECGAICAYLADTFPEVGLAPPPGSRGAYYRWLFFGAGPLEAAVTNKALGVEVPEERRRLVGYGSLELVHGTLAALLARQPYLAGERFTAADVYTGSQIAWGLQFGTLPAHPVLEDYAARITARPAAGRARALDDAAMPAPS
jgi:glutathione S-transferase